MENIIAEAGDLIEFRNPELVARARGALRVIIGGAYGLVLGLIGNRLKRIPR